MKIFKTKQKETVEQPDTSQISVEGELVEQVEDSQVVEKEDKHVGKLTKASIIWSILSTIYAIVSTCIFLKSGWIEHELSYVLIVMLVVFVCIFVGLVVLTIKKPAKTKGSIKTYKTLLKIFKSFANVSFLALSAVSMAGIASEGMTILKWIMFGMTFFVAIVQLALKIALLILKSVRKSIAKRYKVKIHNYANGIAKKVPLIDKIRERTFKE